MTKEEIKAMLEKQLQRLDTLSERAVRTNDAAALCKLSETMMRLETAISALPPDGIKMDIRCPYISYMHA